MIEQTFCVRLSFEPKDREGLSYSEWEQVVDVPLMGEGVGFAVNAETLIRRRDF